MQPIRIVSEDGLWKGVDVRVIDGAVNGVGADASAAASELLRRLQTGSVRAYAASLFLGRRRDPGVLPVATDVHCLEVRR